MKYILPVLFLFGATAAALAAPTLTILPESPMQGDPIWVTLNGVESTTSVKQILFGEDEIKPFLYRGAVAGLYGFDLNRRSGTSTLQVFLRDGTVLSRSIAVGSRKRISAPLGIPQKLGGNTPSSQTKLVSSLADENAQLRGLRTGAKAFWKEPFRLPLSTTTITDTYGYSRLTGNYTIAHKGVDYRASIGTPVYAMNRGVVRLTRTFRTYGKTIVVDHGLGLQTMYMHLSRILVNEGELVLPGQIIGRAGDTGYAESPHLHVSIRIKDVSIDPVRFLSFFK